MSNAIALRPAALSSAVHSTNVDNVTHTLAGMLVAESVCAARSRGPAFRTAAYLTSAFANNLPDIDPIYTWITKPRPLGSLLHHRGHTHTLLVALPCGFLLALLSLHLTQRRHGAFSRTERAWIFALGGFGTALHIGMDFGNSYGVHPFWPLHDGWFYGDAIFIVEPLWLAIALPVLVFCVTSRWLKVLLSSLLAVVLVSSVMLPFITRGSVVALFVLAAVSGTVGGLGSARVRSLAALGGCVSVALGFIAASIQVEAVVRSSVASDFPALRIADVVRSPMPANPLCWSVFVVGTEQARYRVLTANVAALPSWVDAQSCPYDSAATPTAQLDPLAASAHPALRWLREYAIELSELRGLAQHDCRFRALLRFARVPYLGETVLPKASGRPIRVAGDLRYDRSRGLDFADLNLDDGSSCPRFVPPWTAPRSALFSELP